MRTRILGALFTALALAWMAQPAQAGAIRYAGKQLGKGTATVASAAVDGGQAAAGGLASVGKTTGGAAVAGVAAVGKGAAKTPGLAARGAKSGLKALGKVLY